MQDVVEHPLLEAVGVQLLLQRAGDARPAGEVGIALGQPLVLGSRLLQRDHQLSAAGPGLDGDVPMGLAARFETGVQQRAVQLADPLPALVVGGRRLRLEPGQLGRQVRTPLGRPCRQGRPRAGQRGAIGGGWRQFAQHVAGAVEHLPSGPLGFGRGHEMAGGLLSFSRCSLARGLSHCHRFVRCGQAGQPGGHLGRGRGALQRGGVNLPVRLGACRPLLRPGDRDLGITGRAGRGGSVRARLLAGRLGLGQLGGLVVVGDGDHRLIAHRARFADHEQTTEGRRPVLGDERVVRAGQGLRRGGPPPRARPPRRWPACAPLPGRLRPSLPAARRPAAPRGRAASVRAAHGHRRRADRRGPVRARRWCPLPLPRRRRRATLASPTRPARSSTSVGGRRPSRSFSCAPCRVTPARHSSRRRSAAVSAGRRSSTARTRASSRSQRACSSATASGVAMASAARWDVSSVRSPSRRPATLPGRLANGVEQAQLQQPDEQILALGRLGLEEPGELALGQDHAGRELLRGQPEQGGDLSVKLPGVAGDHLPRPLQPGLPRRRPTVAEAHDPDGRPALAGDVEVQPHPGLGAALRDDGRHLPFVAQPGHRAVEGEDHGVDDARLPRSGRAGQREQLDPLEVDDGPLAERGEPLHLETDGPHPAWSSTSSVKSDSRSSSTAPRVSVR